MWISGRGQLKNYGGLLACFFSDRYESAVVVHAEGTVTVRAITLINECPYQATTVMTFYKTDLVEINFKLE